MARTVVRVDTAQMVYSDDMPAQIIGPDTPDETLVFKPWAWDDRIWTSEKYENSDLAIPVLGDTDTRGIEDSYWQSGVGSLPSDLEVVGMHKLRQSSEDRWTVDVRHGEYFRYHDRQYLFANRSSVQLIDPGDNVSGRNVATLDYMPRHGTPILATIWSHDSDGEIIEYKSIKKHALFTGIYTAGVQQETEDDDGDIVWANVDTSKAEFVVKWSGTNTVPVLYFNSDYILDIGPASLTHDDDLELCDFVGESSGDSEQALFTKYFPILIASGITFDLYSGTYTNLLTQNTDYIIDLDRGEITFPEFESDGVTPTGIVPPPAGTKLYAKYSVTPEIEYEPEHSDNVSTATELNLNPMRSIADRGFIYITEHELRVAYIELTSDASVISEGVYGPLYLGTDYCYVIATAYNKYGEPVPDVEIEFYLDVGLEDGVNGRLNGVGATLAIPVSAITDANGQARIVYSAPRSVESLGQYITHPNSDNADELTLLETSGINSATLGNVYLYQVYNDDLFAKWIKTLGEDSPGYGGRKVVLYKWTKTDELGGGETGTRNWRTTSTGPDGETITYRHPRTGEIGAYMPIQPTSMVGSVIGFADDLPFTEDPPEDWALGTFYAVNTIVWHAATNSFYKSLANHTATLVYEPPMSFWETNLNPGNVVAYWVSAGRQIHVNARCFSDLYNSWIYAEPIHFELEVPEFISGVYVSDALNPDKTPYGFRLYDSETMASGLDGTTFLSINPAAGFWPVVNVLPNILGNNVNLEVTVTITP